MFKKLQKLYFFLFWVLEIYNNIGFIKKRLVFFHTIAIKLISGIKKKLYY